MCILLSTDGVGRGHKLLGRRQNKDGERAANRRAGRHCVRDHTLPWDVSTRRQRLLLLCDGHWRSRARQHSIHRNREGRGEGGSRRMRMNLISDEARRGGDGCSEGCCRWTVERARGEVLLAQRWARMVAWESRVVNDSWSREWPSRRRGVMMNRFLLLAPSGGN